MLIQSTSRTHRPYSSLPEPTGRHRRHRHHRHDRHNRHRQYRHRHQNNWVLQKTKLSAKFPKTKPCQKRRFGGMGEFWRSFKSSGMLGPRARPGWGMCSPKGSVPLGRMRLPDLDRRRSRMRREGPPDANWGEGRARRAQIQPPSGGRRKGQAAGESPSDAN